MKTIRDIVILGLFVLFAWAIFPRYHHPDLQLLTFLLTLLIFYGLRFGFWHFASRKPKRLYEHSFRMAFQIFWATSLVFSIAYHETVILVESIIFLVLSGIHAAVDESRDSIQRDRWETEQLRRERNA